MFRKLTLACAAAAAIGTVALAPTTASAWGLHWGHHHHHGHHHHWGHRHFHGLHVHAPVVSCFRWVRTPYGWRRINVCY
jgi:hypothetical protein